MRRRGKRRPAGVASGPAVSAGHPLAFACLEALSPSPSWPPSAPSGQLPAPADPPPHVVRDRAPPTRRPPAGRRPRRPSSAPTGRPGHIEVKKRLGGHVEVTKRLAAHTERLIFPSGV